MSLTQQSLFWTKCPSCLDEIGYTYIQKKCNLRCPRCGRLFNIEEHQDKEQMQIKRLKEEIAKLQQKNKASEKKYKDLEDRFHEKSTKSNEDIWHLKDHNDKLISQIKKSKVKKQRLKQEK